VLDDASRAKFILRAKEQQIMDFMLIERYLRKRSITKLFHYTHFSNLQSILETGIRPRTELNEHLTPFEKCDPHRIDGFLEGFCISIGKPNTFTFDVKNKEKHFNLVILELAANTLLTNSFAAFPTNAADNSSLESVKKQPSTHLGYLGLSRLFLSDTNRSKWSLPDYEPTDLQGEAIFFETIEPSKILKIHFPRYFPSESKQSVDAILINYPKLQKESPCECGILNRWSGEFRKYNSSWDL
jgi:hypothetical protein